MLRLLFDNNVTMWVCNSLVHAVFLGHKGVTLFLAELVRADMERCMRAMIQTKGSALSR